MKQPLGVTASNFHTVGVADGWRYGYEYFAFPRLAPPPTKSEFSEAGNRAVLGGPEFRARPSSHPAAESSKLLLQNCSAPDARLAVRWPQETLIRVFSPEP